MKRAICREQILTLLLLIFTVKYGLSQSEVSNPLRIMFYNVENLFDIYNDSITNDEDFTPAGVLRWNYTRYNKKINSIYKTIVAAGEWSPPEIVAMCEVENRKVLENLIYGTYLSKNNYGLIHEESPDLRGIDVCLVYRTDVLSLITYDYWMPKGITKDYFATRKVLYSKFKYNNDTIHLIVNHWPSRRGGVLAGEGMRIRIANMVMQKADSIALISQYHEKIIIMGDFNCTPDDQEIKILIPDSLSTNRLVNLTEDKAAQGFGTYRYQGAWEMIDQILVSDYLLKASEGLYTEKDLFSIIRPDFLLMKDPKYPGYTPLATYRGYRYQGGFSDHLPVLLQLNFRVPGKPE